jgi:tight adherence protein B
MTWLLALIFLGVFAVCTLLLIAGGSRSSDRSKKTLAVLQAAMATATLEAFDPTIDIRKQEMFSAIPWINRWLLKLELAPRLRNLLRQADLKWTAGGLLLMCATCCMIPTYWIYVRTGNFFISLLIGLLLGSAPFGYVLHKRKRRFDKFNQGLPEALDLVVSALRAGNSFTAALDMMGQESPDPIGSEFRMCYDEQNYGLELRTAMENLVVRVPLQDLKIAVTAILIQKESGGNLAEVLDKTSYVIRERFRLRRQVRVHTAQGRLTGWILSFLPVVLGIALYLVNPKTMSILWTRAIGIKLLYISAGMTFVGSMLIRKIVNMDV